MELLIHFMKTNLVFTVLYLGYLVALRKETWFLGRRAWLMGSAIIAVMLPFLPATFAVEDPFTYALPELAISKYGPGLATGTDPVLLLGSIHLILSGALLALLVARVFRTFKGAQISERDAFSFFRRIHLPSHLVGAERDAIARHEQVHVEHGHSFDVLFFEILSALFWSNPLWRIALRELRLVHEHTADAEAGQVHAGYDTLLVARTFGVPSHVLANSFHSSNLKKRITMMNDPRSPKKARPRLLLALPLLVLATALISWQAVPFKGPAARAKAPVGEVDKMPEFPGGMDALVQYLGANVKYPKAASKAGVEGVCHVSFLVQADGNLQDASVAKSVRDDIDAEALRVVKGMPNWKPAMKDGKMVAAKMTLPIAFKLASE